MPDLVEFLARVPHEECTDPQDLGRVVFHSVSTDSRSLSSGALFFALSGPNFDGSAFVAGAVERGAVAAVVARITPEHRRLGVPIICVPDVLRALTQWAEHWRAQWSGRVTAVCGSNGKTTVKQMIAAVFSQAVGTARSWATPGNLNNHIGVPLSVSGLSSAHQLAVLELGMNHPGEISALAMIARPQVAVVTNAQREHQEFMKSVAAVAEENGQVFAALPPDGVAVFPRDPAHELIWRAQIGARRMIRFGFADAPGSARYEGDEVLGQWVLSTDRSLSHLQVTLPSGEVFDLPLQGVGDHFALNALAAIACSVANAIDVTSIRQALTAFVPVKGRGQRRPLGGGGVLVDDTYNANPDSVRAAIDALGRLPAPRGLVLGDMGEVGDQEAAFHQEVLRYANDHAIDAIWLHGPAFTQASRTTGIGRPSAELAELIERVRQWSRRAQSDAHAPSVWVKGSRFMAMERVVEHLVAAEGEVSTCC